MCTEIDKLIDKTATYVILGQICIDKNYRGQRVFRGLYNKFQENFKDDYDYVVTVS